MKRIIQSTAILSLIFIFSNSAFAQKIGHLNFQNVLQAMPEYKTASDEYELYKQSLEDDLRAIETEAMAINKKMDVEQKKPVPNQTRLSLYAKQLEAMQYEYQAQQQTMQDSLNAKMSQLIAPLKKLIEEAVASIAKERGYSHVIDNTYGMLLYAEPEHDLEQAVKDKLGIKDKPAANPGAGKPGTRNPMPGTGMPGGSPR